MKRVAGRLKLELSQYRELEAFAQFGSDLDADTQRTLARGERLVKALNQGERQPLAVEDQVLQVYAATNGYLDRILVDRVPEFLADLIARAALPARGAAREDRRAATGPTRRRPRVKTALDEFARGLRLRPRRGGRQPLDDEPAPAPRAGRRRPPPSPSRLPDETEPEAVTA